MHRIFENRRHPVAVKLFIPNAEILRLTPGLRMQIEEMEIAGEAGRAFAELAPYIEDSSYPLKWLKVYVFHYSIFQNAKLRSAKHLVVDGMTPIGWHHIFLNLENHQVHVMEHNLVASMPVDDFMVLVTHWTSTEKEVGASFSYRHKEYNTRQRCDFHKEVFKRIKKIFKEAVLGHRCAMIPTDNGTALKVSVELSGDQLQPWNLVLQILRLEQ